MTLRGDRIIQFRKQLGMTQAELAEKLDVHQNQVSRYERELVNPTLESLSELADLFNTTTDYLLGRSDKPHSEAASNDDLTPAQAEMIALMQEYDPVSQTRLVEMIRMLRDVKRTT